MKTLRRQRQLQRDADRVCRVPLVEVADRVEDIHLLVLDIDGRVGVLIVRLAERSIMHINRHAQTKTDHVRREIVIVHMCSALCPDASLDVLCLPVPSGDTAVETHLEKVLGMQQDGQKKQYDDSCFSHSTIFFSVHTSLPFM